MSIVKAVPSGGTFFEIPKAANSFTNLFFATIINEKKLPISWKRNQKEKNGKRMIEIFWSCVSSGYAEDNVDFGANGRNVFFYYRVKSIFFFLILAVAS